MGAPIIRGFSPAEKAAMVAARNRLAHENPAVVRAAVLAAPRGALRPVVLSDWLALEELRSPFVDPAARAQRVRPTDAARLLFVLANDPPVVRAVLADQERDSRVAVFVEKIAPGDFWPLVALAQDQLRAACATVIAHAKPASRDPFAQVGGRGCGGLGWALNLLDALCFEFKWTPDYVLDRLPLAQAFAFYTALKERYGQALGGPGYVEQEILAARRSAAGQTDRPARPRNDGPRGTQPPPVADAPEVQTETKPGTDGVKTADEEQQQHGTSTAAGGELQDSRHQRQQDHHGKT